MGLQRLHFWNTCVRINCQKDRWQNFCGIIYSLFGNRNVRAFSKITSHVKPALRLAHILLGREIYKVDASRKFDINKDATNICRKTTCMHRNCFCKHGVEERIIFHSSPVVTLFFRDTGGPYVYLCFQFSNQKINPSTKIVLRKECREIPHKHFWLWDDFQEKREGKYCRS